MIKATDEYVGAVGRAISELMPSVVTPTCRFRERPRNATKPCAVSVAFTSYSRNRRTEKQNDAAPTSARSSHIGGVKENLSRSLRARIVIFELSRIARAPRYADRPGCQGSWTGRSARADHIARQMADDKPSSPLLDELSKHYSGPPSD